VAATGPTVIPPLQSEVQKVFIDAEGGTFTLTARHLAAVGVGDLEGPGAPGVGGTGKGVTNLITSSGAFAVGQAIEGVGIPLGTTLVQAGGGTATLSQAASGVAKRVPLAAYDSPATTTVLPYNATAAEVQGALEVLPAVGAGNVTVSGGPGSHNAENPYVVVFGGSLANTNVAQLTPNGGSLTNGSAAANTIVGGGQGTSTLALMVQNIGGGESSGTITYKATLPSGFTSLGTPGNPKSSEGIQWACGASTPSEIICTVNESIAPSLTPQPINATIMASPGTDAGVVHMKVEGGNAPTETAELPLTVSAVPAKPGVQSFAAGAFDDEGNFDTRAGGHPYSASAAIFANTIRSAKGFVVPAGEFKDITVELPTGFLGNPIAVPECPESTQTSVCPLNTMVAVVQPVIQSFGLKGIVEPVFNTEAPFGYPAKYRFEIVNAVALNVVGSLRSDGDYGLDAASLNTPQIAQVYGTFFTFWGEPAAASHDSSRCYGIELKNKCEASDAPNTALLSNATNCAEQRSIAASNGGLLPTGLKTNTWQNPGEIFSGSIGIPPVAGCENLKFEADFTFEPSETKSDSTASFRTSLTVPSDGLTDPSKLMTPEIKDTVVTLPKGVVLNASGADGLEACSLQQIGYKGGGFPMPNPMRFNKEPNQCPEASKIGTGELKTALLANPLKGALYLAAQGNGNPFGSLFAIYLVIEDPATGIFIKLPGRVDPSEQDGQMTVTFNNLPQLPFTRLDLNLKGGNRSALASPSTCGNFVTTATNTPWSAPESGPPTVSANGFQINQGPNGQPCAKTMEERPFDIGWKASAQSAKAGVDGPFSFQITRPDGSQELSSLELTTPKGLSASLKGIPYCSGDQIAAAERRTGREELAGSACPAASQVGTLQTGAGSGPAPFYVGGKLYLAGPYKGAPISVVAVTPAVAGPFDLGNVVVRAAVNINRTTAQVTAKSDPIPQILKGVVLRIKDVRIKLDRKDWTINPTSCEPSTVNLKALGNSGATAEKSTRFQVGGCKDLAFKPKLTAHLTGGTKRGAHPAFTAAVTYPQGAGYANTKDVQVTLPHSEFLDQAHINTICTRVQAAANACPKGSIYGFAEATTPLIDGKLTGPVFLKSSSHQLPDLAIALKGPDSQPVEVEFQGRIDSVKAQIRNTIEGLPDVPVTKFVLKMKGGKKGLLVNSRNLCAGKVTKMTVKMAGQNNKMAESRPPLTRKCKGAGAGKAKKAKKAGKRQRSQRLSGLGGGW